MGRQEILMSSKPRKATKWSFTPGITSKILFYINDEFIFPSNEIPQPLKEYLKKRRIRSEAKVWRWIKHWGPEGKNSYPPENPVVCKIEGFLNPQTCRLIYETAQPKLAKRSPSTGVVNGNNPVAELTFNYIYMKNPDDNLINEPRSNRDLRTVLHNLLIELKIYEMIHHEIVAHYECFDKRTKDAFLSCYPEPTSLPTQAFINYYKKSSHRTDNLSGMNEHRDRAPFRSVVILLSETDENEESSLHIDDKNGNSIPFKLSRGDLLMFSRCNHGVPVTRRSRPRATLVIFY